LEDFNKDASRKDGRYPYCRPHQNQKNAKHYEENRENRIVIAAEYRGRNRETITVKARAYGRTNAKKIAERQAAYRAADPLKTKVIAKRYRQNNPDKILDRVHVRRARKKENDPVDKVSRRKVWDRDKGHCQICGNPVEFKAMHLDHKVPISKKGTHTYDNVQTTCKDCNLAKGDR
jgi:5-methylcytosine-specific restriction endonuclease McrA